MNMSAEATTFFIAHYQRLRSNRPMLWMERLFADVIAGRHPRLVDLPTGAGKTELAIIWLLALAWFGKTRREGQPVPRRLVWVVNRRVLVQQVFQIAQELIERLKGNEEPELEAIREGLRALSGNAESLFEVVQLRGQIVADRDWAIRPVVPQLIIGTVDQIGSRLLFQGYGLGKWGRPQQAGLLGVDSWIAVDEAHLVPAFVLTLRQLRERCASSPAKLPAPFDCIFARLPFWLTELSATPGLPPPSAEKPFRLTQEEEDDPSIASRVLAASTRQVHLHVLKVPKGDKLRDVLIRELKEIARRFLRGPQSKRVAIFVREVAVANSVASELKKAGVSETSICKITGRIRGYERDRVARDPVFQQFLSGRGNASSESLSGAVFLIGTAAAEVGLDADADVILSDLAPLPVLLQRLGRLDRRGVRSRRHKTPPTMHLFAPPESRNAKILARLEFLAGALKADTNPCSPELMIGAWWVNAIEAKVEGNPAEGDEADDEKSASKQSAPFIEAATWRVLAPKPHRCSPPATWLAADLTRVAAGPVVVPPLTGVIIDTWSATTDSRSPHLSPHPFLYGFQDDDEGTPLAGLAFRIEIEALREGAPEDEAELDTPDVSADVLEIFRRFPPLRAELHYVKLAVVREWLASPAAAAHPLVYRDRDKWRAKPAGESGVVVARALGPNGTLILPAAASMKKPCESLTKDCERKQTALCDVLSGVSEAARYRREVKPVNRGSLDLLGEDGAYLWDAATDEESFRIPPPGADWKPTFHKRLRIGSAEYVFRYFRPARDQTGLQYLDDHSGVRGHLTRAADEAARLAAAVAPRDEFLSTLLVTAARHHDDGKRFPKWQRAFGRVSNKPELAKLHPDLEKNAPLHGFRHEWESLCLLEKTDASAPETFPSEIRSLWGTLLRHFVGVHHGHLRPSIDDAGLTPNRESSMHDPLRLAAAERFVKLQRLLGPWRLAYLEALLKTADAEASQEEDHDED